MLAVVARIALNRILPDDLAASTEERVAIESEGDVDSRVGPGLKIVDLTNDAAGARTQVAAVTGTAIRLAAQVEPAIERSVRIIEPSSERLLTVIEFIGPSNKKNPGMADFRAKRAELLSADVNFVEIDLVRQGNWRAVLRPHICAPRWTTPYRATIRTPADPAGVILIPMALREALPSIPLPLRDKDPEVRLQLQDLVNEVYETGRYFRRMDYRAPLDQPLEGEDQAWAEALLREAGKLA